MFKVNSSHSTHHPLPYPALTNMPARYSRLTFLPSLLAIWLALATGHSRAQLTDEVPFITSPDNVRGLDH